MTETKQEIIQEIESITSSNVTGELTEKDNTFLRKSNKSNIPTNIPGMVILYNCYILLVAIIESFKIVYTYPTEF